MTTMGVREHEERGLSSRHLILLFLAVVSVCGVFFSLGFVVGYNERFSRSTPSTEVVNAPAVVPPPVNPPAESTQTTTPRPAATQSATNPEPGTKLSQSAGPPEVAAEVPRKAPEAPSPAPQPTYAQAPATEPEAPSQLPPLAAGGEVGEGVTLQVAAMRTKQDAEALVNILKGRGYPVFLVTPEYARADDNLFRVQVGPFTTRDDAEKVRIKLSQEGFKPFIRH